MSVSITFETLVARLGFRLATCVCDKELDEQFWSEIPPDQKESLLHTALGSERYPRWGVSPTETEDPRIGDNVITRFASTFDDWITAYRQTLHREDINDKLRVAAVEKLKELATVFREWEEINSCCCELRELSLSKMDRLAHTCADHAAVLIAASGKTMAKVAVAIEQAKEQARKDGVQFGGAEECDLAKDIELETEFEKRHLESLRATSQSWRQIWELMCLKNSNHPIACKALRESEEELRNPPVVPRQRRRVQ